jgi:uncharacterized protein with ParB-like and HNH nuclease domain
MKRIFIFLSTLCNVLLYSSEQSFSAVSAPIAIINASPEKGNAKRVIVELRDFQRTYCKIYKQKSLLKQTIYAIPEAGLTDYERDEFLSILVCQKNKIMRKRERRTHEQAESTHID